MYRRLDENNSNFIPFSFSLTFSLIVTRFNVTTRAAIAYETFESAVTMQPAAWKRAALVSHCEFFFDRISALDSSDETFRIELTWEKDPCRFPWLTRSRCRPDCFSRAAFSFAVSASLPVFAVSLKTMRVCPRNA